MKYSPLEVGDKKTKYPLVQGGMGVGISLGRLAGAVAKAGGIVGFNIMVALQHYKEYVIQAAKLGADGVQVASSFVTTVECDAAEGFKQKYIEATKEDIRLVTSPVGMPGRAIRNAFIERVESGIREPVKKCYGCLKKCNPAEIPYCITQALITSAKGDGENGLVFCGAGTYKITQISTVQEVIENLFEKC